MCDVLLYRVEDHDDLLPIFDRLTEVLSDNYGDYYLAELIEAQDDNMKCIVAEVNSEVCFFVGLNLFKNEYHSNKSCLELRKLIK